MVFMFNSSCVDQAAQICIVFYSALTSTVHVSCAVSQYQIEMGADQSGVIKMAQPLPGLGTYNQMVSFRNELAYKANQTCVIPRIMELTAGRL